MAAPNYAAYDGRDQLNASEAGHLWVEMNPVAERGGQTHPGPADTGWKYAFWTWLKEEIHKRTGVKPLGHIQYPRGLYRQIAVSDEYKAQLASDPFKTHLKAKPWFLFPEDRKESPTTSRAPKEPPAAMMRLARLIRQEVAPNRLTPSTATGWLETSTGLDGEVDMGDGSLNNIGFEKIVYSTEGKTIFYFLIGDEIQHQMAMRTFGGYIQKVNKEANKKIL